MGTLITFPAERCSAPTGLLQGHDGANSSVIILPVVRVERHGDHPSDGLAPNSSSPSGKRRKR
jgi:hypothetical protein